jgi:hypothetical protein
MHYNVQLTNINPDFSVEPKPEEPWTVRVDSDEEMIFLMNRVAVTSSQETMLEFPELEITVFNKRVLVTAIEGMLYYTEPRSENRQNLKVIPQEVICLLANKPFEEISPDASPAEVNASAANLVKGRGLFSWPVLLLACLVLAIGGGGVLLKKLTIRPSLVGVPRFIPVFVGEKEVIDRFSDVYASEYSQGALVFRLTQDGQAEFYEMWRSEESKRFILVETESLKLQVGAHEGKVALLAGGVHLLVPKDDNLILFDGNEYKRHRGQLNEIGEVLKLNVRPAKR